MCTKYGGVCYFLINCTIHNKIYCIGILDSRRYKTCSGEMIIFNFLINNLLRISKIVLGSVVKNTIVFL